MCVRCAKVHKRKCSIQKHRKRFSFHSYLNANAIHPQAQNQLTVLPGFVANVPRMSSCLILITDTYSTLMAMYELPIFFLVKRNGGWNFSQIHR